jgi:hypothetical protein
MFDALMGICWVAASLFVTVVAVVIIKRKGQ